MKRSMIVGTCLACACVLSMLATSAAQASGPEWGRCVAQKKSEYTNSSCTTKSSKPHKGKYEWQAGPPPSCLAQKKGEYTNATCTTKSSKPHKGKYEKGPGPDFKISNSTTITVTGEYISCIGGPNGVTRRLPKGIADCEQPEEVLLGSQQSLTCTGTQNSSGEFVGTNQVANVKIVLTGCTFATFPVETVGKASGEVETSTLKGKLGFIAPGAPHVGLLLEAATAGHSILEFESPNYELSFVVGVGNKTEGAAYSPEATGGYDGVVAPIGPVETSTSTFTQTYATNASEVEGVPSKLESESHQDQLETYLYATETRKPGEEEVSSEWSQAGEKGTYVLTPGGSMEIRG